MDYNELLIDCVCDLTQEESQEAIESLMSGDLAQSMGLLRLAEIIRSRLSQETEEETGVFEAMNIDRELDFRERARDLADSINFVHVATFRRFLNGN